MNIVMGFDMHPNTRVAHFRYKIFKNQNHSEHISNKILFDLFVNLYVIEYLNINSKYKRIF